MSELKRIDRFRFRYWDEGDKKMYPIYLFSKLDEEMPVAMVMQCTDIKDKHGVLIYEGDIIKEEETGKIFVVEIPDLYFHQIGNGLNPEYFEIIGHKFDGRSYE